VAVSTGSVGLVVPGLEAETGVALEVLRLFVGRFERQKGA